MGEIPEALAKGIQILAGSAAGIVRERIYSERRSRRRERQAKLIEESLKMIQGSSLKATAVSPEILLPILDYAAVADDTTLRNAWAVLLANAALLRDQLAVTGGHAGILKQLSPVEAKFLLSLFDFLRQRYRIDPSSPRFSTAGSITLGTDADLLIRYLKLGLGRPTATREQALRNIPGDLRDFMAILDHLARLNLLFFSLEDEAPGWGTSSGVPDMDPVRIYHLTMLGYRFVRACQAPQHAGT